MTTFSVRFFAGAADAAGNTQQDVELPAGATLADLVTELGASNPRLAEVLKVCTMLVGQRPAELSAALPNETTTIDVLPPFAGG